MTARTPGGGDEHPLTIDELAAASGVASRTIRYYQTKGVLPHPSRRSRSSSYGPEHLERLRLIGELQDRGLRLDAIRDVVRQYERGGDSIQDWLGLGQPPHELVRAGAGAAALTRSAPRTAGSSQPHSVLRTRRGRRLGRERARASRCGSRRCLRRRHTVAARPQPSHGDAGIDLHTALGAERILRRRLSKLADEMVDHFAERAGRGFGAANTAADLARASDALAGLGPEAVQLVFTQEMQRSLLRFVDRGGGVAPDVPKAGRSARRRGARSG